VIRGESLRTLSRLSAGIEFTPDWASKTGVEGDLIGDSVVSNRGTIKPVDVALLQVLPVEFAGFAGGVKTKVIELAASRRMFCCVEFPGAETPEEPAREGADMLASCWFAMSMVVFTAAARALVTNASAMVTKSPVSVKAAML
jgi:hypothetical protein